MNEAFSKDKDSGKDRVFFFDTTLRDGEQSPGCSMTTEEKLRMAHALEALGVDIIEAGFAIASPGDFAAISSICQAVRGPRIASLARARSEDIEAAARSLEGADRSRIHIFLASSDIHLEHKLKIQRAEALEQVDASVRLARTDVDDVEFSPEDASRSDRLSLPDGRRRHRRRGIGDQSTGHCRLLRSPGVWRYLYHAAGAGSAGSRHHAFLPLPQRPGHGGGQYLGCSGGRRKAD